MAEDAIVAERIVLGAVMSGAPMPNLHPDEFARPVHGELWRRMLTRSAEGLPLDPQAVMLAVRDEPIPGFDLAEIAQIYGCVPVAAAAPYYANIVRDFSDLRAIHAAGQKLTQAATISDGANARAHARATLDALDLRETRQGTSAGDALIPVLHRIENGTAPGLTTPWIDVDRAIGGLRPGTSTVIAARPGLGKSIIGLQIAAHVARKHGRALVHSLEMTTDELMTRLISSISLVSYSSLASSSVSPIEWDRIDQVASQIAGLPLFIEDQATVTIGEIAASARRHAREGLQVLVVDYLQLITPTDSRLPREQQVAECSRSLKVLAKDLGIAVVLLAQLNRESEKRASGKPILSDLRESGSVEQDADVVALLWRDADRDSSTLELGIAKNRGGPCGPVELHWDAAHMRVTNSARTP